MDELIINEGHSVGLFNFGMKIEEVEHYSKLNIEKYNIHEDSFFFEYDEEGKVIDIHLIIEDLKHHFQCKFKGIDILNTKAIELIELFDTITPYLRDPESSLGYSYQFLKLGLSFWRGNVCNEKDLESDWFKELHPEIQEDNKRFLYFETVTFHLYRLN
ncbi:hypothetical protein [Sporosarcina limicola]|uniref:Uncharacterized protein n=1 Tax=Sporosarcina limicola TaxID=34101 RepID=A0A927R5I2_9BACL|nr:hypothetical protein [Sporosarcina limicola]MBE1556068.1 hypothetical protein [Sporosarcina limicola]